MPHRFRVGDSLLDPILRRATVLTLRWRGDKPSYGVRLDDGRRVDILEEDLHAVA